MKESRFRYHAAEVPLYFGSIQVVVSHKLDEAYRACGFDAPIIRGRNADSFDAISDEAIKDGHTGYFVFLRPNTTPKIIAHEAVHLVNKIFIGRGITLDAHNDEPQAYLMGWIVEQIHYALSSKKIKAKKIIKLR